VDWDSESGQIIRCTEPKTPVLIYPAQTKFQLSYEVPYLESMARFQMALRETDVGLVVIGFGFRDEHLAGPISAAIRSNVGLRAVVVAPDLESTENVHVATMRDLVEAGDKRLTLVASTFRDFARLLPDISPRDEREEHAARIDFATRRDF
jgi:hypothetical protein